MDQMTAAFQERALETFIVRDLRKAVWIFERSTYPKSLESEFRRTSSISVENHDVCICYPNSHPTLPGRRMEKPKILIVSICMVLMEIGSDLVCAGPSSG